MPSRLDAFRGPPKTLVASLGDAEVLFSHGASADVGAHVGLTAEPENAFALIYQLGPLHPHDIWLDGRHGRVPASPPGSMHILDLSQRVEARLPAQFDSLNIRISCAALDSFAERHDLPAIGGLKAPEDWSTIDPVVRSLQGGLVHAIDRSGESCPLVHDQLALALIGHLARVYGDMRALRPARGGLAPWQERRAKERIAEDFGRGVSLAGLAEECGLSPSHFSRAFKASTGLSPFAWLQRHRVQFAKNMLRDEQVPLAEIALRCGFADQSHFIRVFLREAGMTPGAWRRERRRA